MHCGAKLTLSLEKIINPMACGAQSKTRNKCMLSLLSCGDPWRIDLPAAQHGMSAVVAQNTGWLKFRGGTASY